MHATARAQDHHIRILSIKYNVFNIIEWTQGSYSLFSFLTKMYAINAYSRKYVAKTVSVIFLTNI